MAAVYSAAAFVLLSCVTDGDGDGDIKGGSHCKTAIVRPRHSAR